MHADTGWFGHWCIQKQFELLLWASGRFHFMKLCVLRAVLFCMMCHTANCTEPFPVTYDYDRDYMAILLWFVCRV